MMQCVIVWVPVAVKEIIKYYTSHIINPKYKMGDLFHSYRAQKINRSDILLEKEIKDSLNSSRAD